MRRCVLAYLDIHAVILINTLKINGLSRTTSYPPSARSFAVIAIIQLGPVEGRNFGRLCEGAFIVVVLSVIH